MKLKNIFILFLMYAAVHFVQGQTVNELFVKIPDPAFLPLSVSDRLDLIDLYKAGEKAAVKNLLEDSCSIFRLTDNYMQIQTGKNTIELFLLPLINDSKIVGLIQTVCAPVCDSKIEFYTITWKKLDTSVFFTYANAYDFLKAEIQPEEENVSNALTPLDVSFVRLQYDPDKQELQQYYTTPDYLSEADRSKVMPFLRETPKALKWNMTRFE